MDHFIRFAKCLMLLIWAIMLANLLFPFPGKAAIAFYFLLAFTAVMHFIQLLVIVGAFGEKLKLNKRDALSLFVFGVFRLWQIKGRLI